MRTFHLDPHANITWQPLSKHGKQAAGAFNTIYVSDAEYSILNESNHPVYFGRLVFKNPEFHFSEFPLNDPDRAVRVFLEVNHVPNRSAIPALKSTRQDSGTPIEGWVLPYFENTTGAPDEECAEEVLRIYKATERIVYDFAVIGNALKITWDNSTSIACIDVDGALLLESDFTATRRQRRGSDASCDFYSNNNVSIEALLQNKRLVNYRPRTIAFIRTLLCLHQASLSTAQREKLTYNAMVFLAAAYMHRMDFYDENPNALRDLLTQSQSDSNPIEPYMKESLALENSIQQSNHSLLALKAKNVLLAVQAAAVDNLQDLPKMTEVLQSTHSLLNDPASDARAQYNVLAQSIQLNKKEWGKLVSGAMFVFAGALLCTCGSLLICAGIGAIPYTFGLSAAVGIGSGSGAIVAGLALIAWGRKTFLSTNETQVKKAMGQFFKTANSTAAPLASKKETSNATMQI